MQLNSKYNAVCKSLAKKVIENIDDKDTMLLLMRRVAPCSWSTNKHFFQEGSALDLFATLVDTILAKSGDSLPSHIEEVDLHKLDVLQQMERDSNKHYLVQKCTEYRAMNSYEKYVFYYTIHKFLTGFIEEYNTIDREAANLSYVHLDEEVGRFL